MTCTNNEPELHARRSIGSRLSWRAWCGWNMRTALSKQRPARRSTRFVTSGSVTLPQRSWSGVHRRLHPGVLPRRHPLGESIGQRAEGRDWLHQDDLDTLAIGKASARAGRRLKSRKSGNCGRNIGSPLQFHAGPGIRGRWSGCVGCGNSGIAVRIRRFADLNLINEFCTVVETGCRASARPAWHWQGYALVITSTGDPESGKRGVEIILRRNPDTYHSWLSTGIDRNALHLRTAKGSSEDIE